MSRLSFLRVGRSLSPMGSPTRASHSSNEACTVHHRPVLRRVATHLPRLALAVYPVFTCADGGVSPVRFICHPALDGGICRLLYRFFRSADASTRHDEKQAQPGY